MLAVKYTGRYHPRRVKKIGHILLISGSILIILQPLISIAFGDQPFDVQLLVNLSIQLLLRDLFRSLIIFGFITVAIGSILSLFKWRAGTVEVTEERLVISGSYPASIRLKNLFEVDVIDTVSRPRIIRVDSKTDAVQLKFRDDGKFEDIRDKLISLVRHEEYVKIKGSNSEVLLLKNFDLSYSNHGLSALRHLVLRLFV